MLQHRLPLDVTGVCTWTPAPLPRDITCIPRVNLRVASAVMAAYDLLCALIFLSAIGVAHVVPGSVGIVPAFCAWTLVTVLLGTMSVRATGIYAKQTLMKGKSLPALAVLAGTASFMPALLITLGSAAYKQVSLFPTALCAAASVLSVAAGHVVWHLWLDRLLKHGHCLDRVIVLAETASEARVFAASMEQRSFGRLRATSSFAISDAAGAACFSWMQKAIRLADADQIVIAEGHDPRPSDRSMIFQLVRGGADVTVVPRLAPAYRVSAASSLSPDLPPMHGPMPPLASLQAIAKRALDMLGAILAIVITLPACLLIALAIKLDSRGPVLFKQTRFGANGEVFRIWKFRTMFADTPDQDRTLQTRRGDPRVTAVGRFLRRTSLDELPQLANVVTGDMSIVGPRPHAVGMLVAGTTPEQLLADYGLRHRMKPGITGWAQVHGSRGELDSARALRRRFALDRHYIENWSLRMDILIILRTLALPFMDRHAF
jgi:polysaccharide biosynthesis protein PslA